MKACLAVEFPIQTQTDKVYDHLADARNPTGNVKLFGEERSTVGLSRNVIGQGELEKKRSATHGGRPSPNAAAAK